MANRRPQQGGGGRRMDFRNDRNKNFGRSSVSPWQGGGPGGGLPNLLPLGSGPTEATLALASNIINLLQPRQNPVPSLLDMPIRRDFVPNMGRFDRGYVPNRMGNQNFRRTGNYNRSGERVYNNRKPFRPNDGQRQQNKTSPKKEPDSKAKPVKESEKEDGEDKEKATEKEVKVEKEEEEDKKETPKTRYDDINAQLLKCHICNKSMWDGRSFENHLNGRAHAIMMQKTAESYALTADTMRQEFKIKRQIRARERAKERNFQNYQIREMRRTRKAGMQQLRDFYCAMCDMYAGDGAAHRTTVGHRKLKKYLHPSCTCCHKEMPTRIELDEHRLTAEHLRNMQNKQEVISKPKPEVMVISTLSMEQSYLRDERNRRRRDDEKTDGQEKDEAKEDDVEIKKESEDITETEPKQDGDENKPLDKDDTILDYVEGDDLTQVTSEQLPVYSVDRGVGRSFLSEFRCVQCKLCKKLLDTEETAEVHLKTWRHHQLFLRLLNDNMQSNAQQSMETEQPPSDGNKRPLNSEESGNWKRRKTTPDDEDADAEQNGHEADAEEVKEEEPGNAGDKNQSDGWGDTDSDMPPADELEDWGDVNTDNVNEEKEAEANPEPATEPEPEAEAEPAAEPEPEAEAEPETDKPADKPKTATPRGRGRGARRRGRY